MRGQLRLVLQAPLCRICSHPCGRDTGVVLAAMLHGFVGCGCQHSANAWSVCTLLLAATAAASLPATHGRTSARCFCHLALFWRYACEMCLLPQGHVSGAVVGLWRWLASLWAPSCSSSGVGRIAFLASLA